jgi:hypothetical protein
MTRDRYYNVEIHECDTGWSWCCVKDGNGASVYSGFVENAAAGGEIGTVLTRLQVMARTQDAHARCALVGTHD